ncbi:hypothetical protein BDP27DRAFT_1530128 [Rhodocollybia butyracea]|uniref:Protein kinase domain-containing protein n=1 Tax=Rhodocollybia butyracea TaxID=206335 RepID=A0A9P5PU70_9AGAR|nr:hypothetical protein BDP27DRAFT_1530128 [Rhodocollybia butyracea]
MKIRNRNAKERKEEGQRRTHEESDGDEPTRANTCKRSRGRLASGMMTDERGGFVPDKPSASERLAVYLASWAGKAIGKGDPGYVMKIFKEDPLTQTEIDGLKRVRQYVKVDEKEKAIVMVEARGKTLEKLLKDHPEGGEELLERCIPKIAAEAARIAHTYDIYHGDLHEGNIRKDKEIRKQKFKEDVAAIQKYLKSMEHLWLGNIYE